MDDTRFHTTNPLVTNEDIQPHYGVGAVVHDQTENPDRILLLWHNKYQFWTMPIGKAGVLEDREEVMRRELKEEIGIEAVNMTFMGSFYKRYHRGKDIYTNIVSQLYEVHNYTGTVSNKEPEKHRELRWHSINQIERLPEKDTSDMLRFWLLLVNGILSRQSRQLVK